MDGSGVLATRAASPVVDFEGLRIAYDERVLAPRAWTAAQSRWAADLIRTAPPGRVLELCAGVGHIGLLAARLGGRSLVCVEADPVACEFLRRNASAAELRVDVREQPMAEALRPDEEFAVIIADPPWVPHAEVSRFPEDPVVAIDGGRDGLDLVRSCLEIIDQHLVVAGSALLQVAPDGQSRRVAELVASYDELEVVEVREYERGALVQIDRVVVDAA